MYEELKSTKTFEDVILKYTLMNSDNITETAKELYSFLSVRLL